ncbi:MAG: hypothetical protein NVS4B2_29870 [Chloroflexota bacterium]
MLHSLALAVWVVTIDARGCQREIAQPILNPEGTCVLALKNSQATLRDDVRLSIAAARDDGYAGIRSGRTETIEKGHGRIVTRHPLVIDDLAMLAWIQERHAWPGSATIGLAQTDGLLQVLAHVRMPGTCSYRKSWRLTQLTLRSLHPGRRQAGPPWAKTGTRET